MKNNTFSNFSLKLPTQESDPEYSFGSVQLKFRKLSGSGSHQYLFRESLKRVFKKSKEWKKLSSSESIHVVLQGLALQIFHVFPN